VFRKNARIGGTRRRARPAPAAARFRGAKHDPSGWIAARYDECEPIVKGKLLAALVACALAAPGRSAPARQAPAVRSVAEASAFASQVEELSEPGGYFDTDNLISNERSYLQVIPHLRRASVPRGAYVGVGPDQNFSYIAAVRPSIAFIVDIRRDNMLLHLLFKALFQLSETRVEYLSMLTGRPPPPALEQWRGAPVERLVSHVDRAALTPREIAALRARVQRVIERFGVPLSTEDRDTIDRFHRRFIAEGLDLRFQSSGRPPQYHYPTYRELLLARDPDGRASNYLGTEEAFQAVKTLQANHLVIPVVGNLSGPSAVASIGRAIGRRGDRLAAFYASNVEFYLFGEGTFGDFAGNLRHVPHTSQSVIVRSIFGRYGARSGGSASQAQSVAAMLEDFQHGRIRSYQDLVQD
jgi:hypothetical protein